MKLVLMGIQGSGKSTQGNLLSEQLGLPYLSTGDIFRQIAKEDTERGKYVKGVMESGHLIPNDKTIEIVKSYLSKPEYKSGFILDGFPRTPEQAEAFKNNIDKVVYIDLVEREALSRLVKRADKEGRSDDTNEALRKRIELFYKHTRPLLEYYRRHGKLISIDGTPSIEKINKEILKKLGKNKR